MTRLFMPSGSMIRKEPRGLGAEQRLRHEVEIRERLSGIRGVLQMVEPQSSAGSILLEDLHGVSLADVPMPLDIDELTRLALGLARVVAAMHARGVVHRDINPANILLSDADREPYLIDFTLATTFTEIRPDWTHHNRIVGTLAFIAPEQTGRTGRPVDQRADLYALGATLYQLATGEPPFGVGDPLRLIHDHLARVPIPPAEVNAVVPAGLSAIIMHLLEKEPDNRYQSADGLIHDLVRLRDGETLARVGEGDVPHRLLTPSRLVGREDEMAELEAAFKAALSGRCPGALVSGPPGVGKTSLVDELRPIVAANGGWFVSGKFDQYRRDLEFDGAHLAFRALGRLLLAEPEEELAAVRDRILRALGPNAGIATATLPEFAALLQVPADVGDPKTAQIRAQRNGVEILRAVACRKRPLVIVIDDLQWAGRTTLGFIDMVLSEHEKIDGLLLVGAYRESDVDATHPLAPMLSRWHRQDARPLHLRLGDLPPSSLAEMLADMLRLDSQRAADLALAITPHTRGNPYDTVELLNALRHDGVLEPGGGGWRWEAGALGALGRTDVAELLAERADAMPPTTGALLEIMACLGGRVDLNVLNHASGLPAPVVEERLAAALDEGLLVLEPGAQEAARFRHDRVQESILHRMGPQREHDVRLDLARRLGGRPEFFEVAAQQYLPVVDSLSDPDERRTVSGVFRHAAEQAKVLFNQPLVERLLAAAAELTDPNDTTALIELHTGRHAALHGLGRLDEADDLYRTIERLCTRPAQRTEATLVQVSSLTMRSRPRDAIDLGLDQLRRLGLAVPAPDLLGADIDDGLAALYRWIEETDEADDLRHPEITDPALLAVGELINRLMPPAFFCDQTIMAWLALQAARTWAEHGLARTLIGPISHVPYAVSALRQDRRTGYRLMRRVLALGEARGHQPETSQARFLYALGVCPWFEPLEDSVSQALRAREGLILGGDLFNACYTYYATTYELLDASPSLDSFVVEVESALEFGARTGNDHVVGTFRSYRRLISGLRGEPYGSHADELAPEELAGNPLAAVNAHVTRALAAAVFDDATELDRHTTNAMPLLPFVESTYLTSVAHLLRALALASRARAAGPEARGAFLTELDAVIDWLATRATDAPINFRHLVKLVEAERAWAVGEFRTAAKAFDVAIQESAKRQRPWHRALVCERAARFLLAHGLEFAGYNMLATARQMYLIWGAMAKVDRLDWAYPTLKTLPDANADPGAEVAVRRSDIMPATIDLLGILSASQALSSETSIDGLRDRVVEVLSAMTGATGIHLLLWNVDRGWLLSGPSADGGTISLDEAGRRHLVPLSVIRYAERTREAFVINDATHDDRFARDPYFVRLDPCSLLAVPIFHRGALQGLLLMENRLIRSAFSADRLDGVMLIAGQLAVSLDNALVYASLERKVGERTHQLALANQRLEELSTTDPVTGLANRRRLEEVLAAEWRHAGRSGEPLGLAMVDIDHFKLFNDHYGHAAGDRCLQRVAAELRQNVREKDLCARYGGEEFAVVMPNTGVDVALQVAERLRAAITTLAEPHPLVPDRLVTVSIGIAATVPAPGGLVDTLMEQADVELYRAKRGGRNRVRVAPSPAQIVGHAR
ncbi:MAG TPA: diguanylate cyclase [Micromonosporaceae bacterium]|nr:diguanylate cyclase [Micromonosporaceae bacterium]